MFMRGDRISDASKKANVDCEYFESQSTELKRSTLELTA
jgi:hypothetical protein